MSVESHGLGSCREARRRRGRSPAGVTLGTHRFRGRFGDVEAAAAAEASQHLIQSGRAACAATRDAAIPVLPTVLAVPVTKTVRGKTLRGVATEVST